MKDGLIILENVRRPHFSNGRRTQFLKRRRTSFFLNESKPQFFRNGRRLYKKIMQPSFKWKMTSICWGKGRQPQII